MYTVLVEEDGFRAILVISFSLAEIVNLGLHCQKLGCYHGVTITYQMQSIINIKAKKASVIQFRSKLSECSK